MLSSGSPGSPGRHSRNASPHLGQQSFLNSSRGRSSRLGVPLMRRASLGSDRSKSPNKFMDVDTVRFPLDKGMQAEEARAFALSDTLSVRLAATLPLEVQQAFQAADPTRDVFTGSVHVFQGPTSYSVVVSVQTCFVWKVDFHSPFHSPTCYMFPVPPPDQSSSYLTVPFASLVPFGTPREPGLILVSVSGEVRFWDSIGTGLAGAERFSTTHIALADNEFVSGVVRVDGTVFVARTRTRLYRLTVTARPGTGKFIVVPAQFNDSQDNHTSSWLSSFRLLQRRNGVWDAGDIAAVVSPRDGKFSSKSKNISARRGEEDQSIWVLTNRNLMKWDVNVECGERCLHNREIIGLVTDAVLNGVEGDRRHLDIELLDVAIDIAGDPILLISHRPIVDQGSSPLDVDTAPLRVYAIIRLYLPPGSDAYELKRDIEVLPYELAADLRHATSPHLAPLPNVEGDEGLELIFSQFSDAFAISSFEPPYQEQLHLKTVEDMVLGFNILERADGYDILLLTTGMVLAARPHTSNIAKMKDDVHIGRANVLKSTIRQAMKYGIKTENPLRFQLPSIADGESLKTAAEQMSHAFLISDPDVVPPTLSLGTQLSSREASLRALITFIGESGGLGKLSHSTREQLLADAEKLAAARGLWTYHNEQAQKSASPNLLPLAIEAYMRRTDGVTYDDAVRTFFNSHVPCVGAVVPEIVGIIESSFSSPETPQTDPYLLVQANGLVLALFTHGFQYRSQNRARYQLDRAIIQPWTSDPSLLLSLRSLFDITVNFGSQIQISSKDQEGLFDGHSTQEDLASQLRELASCLFRVYNDRLDFLDSRSRGNAGGERERNRLEEEFRSLRPMVLGHLVRADSTDYAFRLAETYRDFRALSELSYHVSAVKIIPAPDRIRDYIDRFREEFTTQLYKWYIEQGKLKLLFDQEAEYIDYIDAFFSQNPTPRLSWLHDVGKQDYQHAASALLSEAEVETNRETRHLMLSIGKLASMAQGPAATPQDRVQAFNNSLDFMAIHDTLLEQFNEELGNPANFAVESRVRAITSARCAVPSDRPALQDLFQRILRQLLQGNALTEEDAVDILSMKDNAACPSNFVDALIILLNSSHMSKSRKTTAIRNIWRRIYLHDDWKRIRDTANKTDYELTTKLRDTQLYQVLVSPALPRDSIASPSEATEVPTSEDIERRWPGMAPNQVYELSRDFARESSVLSDHGPTDAEFMHVRNLVEEDTGHKF